MVEIKGCRWSGPPNAACTGIQPYMVLHKLHLLLHHAPTCAHAGPDPATWAGACILTDT